MNKKLVVTLLHKNLEELAMITASFQELEEYPQAIVQLARRKTEDIQLLLDELGVIQPVAVQPVVEAPIVEEAVFEMPIAKDSVFDTAFEVQKPETDMQQQTTLVVEEPTFVEEVNTSLQAIVTDLDAISVEPLLSGIEIDSLPDLIFAPDEQELNSVEQDKDKKEDEDEGEDDDEEDNDDDNNDEDENDDDNDEEDADESAKIESIAPETLLIDEKLVLENVESILNQIEISDTAFDAQIEAVPEPLKIHEEEKQSFVPEITEIETAVVYEIAPQEVKIPTEESKKMTISERMGLLSTSRNDVMAQGQNSLSSSIANKKITDIKQALSIGDRFRFQRELFKSNGEDMNRTLTYLNLLATQSEAMSFLQSKYGWDETSEAAIDFYQLVKRKFL